MPASPSARSSSRPAGPTNGSPLRSSWSPGCSPTKTMRAVSGPSPNTVWVVPCHSSHALHPAAAVRSPSSPTPVGGCAGTFSWLMGPIRPQMRPRRRADCRRPSADPRRLSLPTVHLIGGGWDPSASAAVYGPFLEAAGTAPTVATLVVDEGGHGSEGMAQFARWADVLRRTARCEPVPVLVPLGGQ